MRVYQGQVVLCKKSKGFDSQPRILSCKTQAVEGNGNIFSREGFDKNNFYFLARTTRKKKSSCAYPKKRCRGTRNEVSDGTDLTSKDLDI